MISVFTTISPREWGLDKFQEDFELKQRRADIRTKEYLNEAFQGSWRRQLNVC